jgi:hypothetical protein
MYVIFSKEMDLIQAHQLPERNRILQTDQGKALNNP